jgi:hypothetical protein
LHVEKSLKIVELLGFVFNLLNLGEVFTDAIVSIINNSGRSFSNVVWKVGLELLSEFSNFNLKFSESVLNIGGFFVLKRKNLLFNWS